MCAVAVKWVESKLMVGIDSRGAPLVMGSWPEQETPGIGLKPSDLLLLAAASCTSYVVVMILNKQKEPLKGLEVYCTGEQATAPPYEFKSIHMQFKVKGEFNVKKLERAIYLSEEKYCSVVNTLKPTVTITHEYEIVE